MNLETIKNNYAQEQGYEDWSAFINDEEFNKFDMIFHMDEICIRAQKAALEKAAESLRQCYGSFNSDYRSQQTSITNPENLIR